jgi:hypothetical protein
MAAMHRQRGLSLVGFAFVAAVLAIVAMLGFRIAPSVIEYYSVQQALKDSLQEIRDPANTVREVRSSFEKRANAGYIDSVRASDIEIRRDGNTIVASVAWTRQLHLVANASLLLEFEASASR